MPYCKIKNVLWIHIPKTGGASVYIYFTKKYKKENVTLLTGPKNNILPCPELKKISLQHQTYSNLFKYREMLNIDFNDHLKVFTIVRNPYDRIISDLFGFNYISEHSSKNEVFEVIKNKYLYNENIDNHNIPQYKFITDEEGNLFDHIHILKTENLRKDMIEYGYTDFNIYYGSTKSKGINVDKKNYINYLNDQSIKLINEYYKKDFELFNYDKIIV